MKIEQVTRFKVGNSLYETIEEAERQVRKIALAKDINDRLGATKPDPNGDSYVQHTYRAVARFILDVDGWLEEFASERIVRSWREDPRGLVGRLLDDSGDHIGYGFNYRLACIDGANREWGQPYYANNPNPQAKEVKP